MVKRREHLGIPASSLASRANVHRNTVSRIESGESVSIESLWKICKVLNITIDSLLEESSQPFKSDATQLKFRFKRKYEKRMLRDSARRSDVLPSLQHDLGFERSRSARLQIVPARPSSAGRPQKTAEKKMAAAFPYSRSRLIGKDQ